MKSTRYMAQR